MNEAVTGAMGKELFEKEQDDLLLDLIDIPKKACDRRVYITFMFEGLVSVVAILINYCADQ